MPKIAVKKPNPLNDLYKKYDEALEAIDVHRRKHRTVYERGDELKEVVNTLEKQIKALLAERYLGKPSGMVPVYQSERVVVEVTAKNSRIFNGELMLKEQRALLESIEGAIVHVEPVEAHEEVDLKALDNAVHRKLLDKAIVDKYVKAGDPLTPSVSFKEPKPTKEPG